jgi:hypothetical protein
VTIHVTESHAVNKSTPEEHITFLLFDNLEVQH